MLQPSYKSVMEIPGGIVEQNESPYDACKREVKEELGVNVSIDRMLCVDYNKADVDKTESLMFIFSGGIINSETIENIQVDEKEILGFKFLNPNEIKDFTTETLSRRIDKSLMALENHTSFYLENQVLIIDFKDEK